MKPSKKKDLSARLDEHVKQIVFDYKINRKKMPLSQFLDEVRGFLVSNGVSKEIDQDTYMRTAIKNNHYAIHNYLVERKERSTFRHMLAEDLVPGYASYGAEAERPERVKKSTKYLDRLKKRFPQIEDEDELILDEAPQATVGAEFTNQFYDTKTGGVKPISLWPKKISWMKGASVAKPKKGFVSCEDVGQGLSDCPPVPENKQECCYQRDVDEDSGEKKNTCSLKCKKF